MTLGKTIRTLRKEHGMTQDELAEKLGYKNRSTIANIETGRQDIPRAVILKLAQIFDVPISELMDIDLTITDTSDLSDEELHLITMYRRLDSYRKALVRLAAGEETNKKESGPHIGGSADRE